MRQTSDKFDLGCQKLRKIAIWEAKTTVLERQGGPNIEIRSQKGRWLLACSATFVCDGCGRPYDSKDITGICRNLSTEPGDLMLDL